MKLFLVLSLFISASAFAGNPERMVVIESDDSPGDNFIDLVQNSDGSLQSLVYEADTGNLTFTTQQLQSQPAVLKETSGKPFIIYTFPISISGLTGLPCRVVAEL